MTLRVDVAPAVLRWACERSGRPLAELERRCPGLEGWLRRNRQPTLKQLEAFAHTTHTSIGTLFLATPPAPEELPIADMRTAGSHPLARPSADLLDTIYLCQQRQAWYRDDALATSEPSLAVVGSARPSDDVVTAADRMRLALGLQAGERIGRTPDESFRRLVTAAEDLGVLVMVSGVVGANTHRTLDPEEFRGFALVDDLAPVVFVNGADAKAAQLFTLAHELAHIWLGESALSDVSAAVTPTASIERWCNAVAAELLVPRSVLEGELASFEPLWDQIRRLRGRFGVSALVIIRRLHDVGVLSRDEMWRLYQAEVARLRTLPRPSGGNFYPTLQARVGRRFARAVWVSTWEGRSSFNEAFRLLNIKSTATFNQLGQDLGVRL